MIQTFSSLYLIDEMADIVTADNSIHDALCRRTGRKFREHMHLRVQVLQKLGQISQCIFQQIGKSVHMGVLRAVRLQNSREKTSLLEGFN